MPEEEWRPVVGWEGLYEVSNLGGVRSLDRIVNHGRGLTRVYKGRNRKVYVGKTGYLAVGLSNDGKSITSNVHRMIAEAFIPNPERHPYVRHLNDEKTDNRIENLAWGTPSDNSQDALRNGVHRNQNTEKTSCKRGHELIGENLHVTSKGSRVCKECQKMHQVANREKYLQEGIKDPQDTRHGTLTAYDVYGCRCRRCTDAKRISGIEATKRRSQETLPGDDPRHGTYGCYKVWSCRCNKCRKANSEYERGRKARKEGRD